MRFFRSAIQQQACRAAIAGQILLSLALPATFLLKNRAVDYPVPLDDDLHNKLGVAGQAMLPLSITNLEELELGCLAVAFEVYNGRFVNANHGLDLKAVGTSLGLFDENHQAWQGTSSEETQRRREASAWVISALR